MFDLEAEKEGQKVELALGVNWTRLTAKALMYLVLTTSPKNGSHSTSGVDTSSQRSNSSTDSSAVATPTSVSGSNANHFRSTPTAKSALRRAAIDIIGRGFVLWEPHLEVSKVRNGLITNGEGKGTG